MTFDHKKKLQTHTHEKMRKMSIHFSKFRQGTLIKKQH